MRVAHPAPRLLHPLAWWAWAAGAAVVVTRTRNPLVLALVLAAVVVVAARRRRPGAAGSAVAVFVRLGLVVVAFRLALGVVLGARFGAAVLFTLPEPALPSWLAGLTVGGRFTVEMLLASLYEGLRLAALIICFGAANALASPYRLVRCLPPVLHEAGVALAVGVSLAPQLVVSAGRVRQARRLRGRPGGIRGVQGTVMPVFEEALERAVHTAASMDARGYGRTAAVAAGHRRMASLAMAGGTCALAVAAWGMLDGSAPAAVAVVAGAAGASLVAAGMARAGRRVRRTVLRPDPWALPEWSVASAGALAATVMVLGATAADRATSTLPVLWPTLGWAPVLAAALIASAGWTSPPVGSDAPRTVAPPAVPAHPDAPTASGRVARVTRVPRAGRFARVGGTGTVGRPDNSGSVAR